MKVRRFYLENESGMRKSLMTKDGFMHVPDGLGYGMNITTECVSSGFFEKVYTEYAQPHITGELVFLGMEPYQDFRELAWWIAENENIKLVYIPYGTEEYFIDIAESSIGKSERDKDTGQLICPVSFIGLTPWYNKYPLILQFTQPPEDNYKRYDYIYQYVYAASDSAISIDFDGGGHFNGDCEFYGNGPLIEPMITLSNNNTGEVYGVIDLRAVSIDSNEALYISTRYRGAGIWKIKKDGTRINLMDAVEYSTPQVPLYFKIPQSEKLKITLDTQNGIESDSTLYIYRYWKVV